MGPRLARLVVRRPRTVLALAALLAALVTPLALRLRIDTDMTKLVPGRAEAATAFARWSGAFAGEQPLVVLIESSDGERLTRTAEEYATRLRRRDDIAEVRIRLSGAAARLFAGHLIDLLDDEEIDRLAERTTSAAIGERARRLRSLIAAPGGSALAPLLTADPFEILPLAGERLKAGLPVDATSGYFKNAEGNALLLFVKPRFAPSEVERSRALLAALGTLAEEVGAKVAEGGLFPPPGATPVVGFTGVYAHWLAYRDWLHHDTQVSTTVSILAVLLFFAVLLGALRALPLVALPLLYGLFLTVAAAGVIYGRVNAVSLAFGTILVSIGIDVPIQIYNRLRDDRGDEAPALLLERTIGRLAGPALLATLGPAVVCLACTLSDYRGLAELGVLATVGLLLNLVSMLIVLPALWALMPPSWWLPRAKGARSGRWFSALGRLAAAQPKLVLLGVSLVAIAGLPLALRVRFEERLISSAEPPGMPQVRVQRELEARFGNRHTLLVVLVDDPDGDRALQKSDAWRAEGERLRRRGLLASYQSVSTLIPSRAEQERRRARFGRQDPPRIARELGAALDEAGFERAPFQPYLDRLANPPPPLALADAGDELAFLVRAHVHDGPSGRTVAIYFYPRPERIDDAVAALDDFARRHGGAVTGVPILEATLRRVLARDTWRVAVAALVGVAALLIVYYRRWRQVVAVLVPLAFAWLFFAEVMGAAGLPLNLFNLLAVPLVVGYGIDDHVFLLHRHGERPEGGPERALASTGRAIVVTSLSTMAGFAGLAPARFDGLRLLGLSGAIAVGLCLIAAMAVLPALLALLWPRRGRGD